MPALRRIARCLATLSLALTPLLAGAQAVGNAGRFDCDASDAAAIDEAYEGAGLLDDAGEHGYSVGNEGTGNKGTGNKGPKGCRR